MTKYKLLGIDLDGTLLSKLKRISKPNLEAIKDYIQQGGIPVVTTGRSIVSAEIFAKQLDAFSITKSPFVIAFNGAYIKDLTTNKIFENKISDSIVREIKKYTEGNKLIL
jgi:hydroxymethylpyrimidine pyrophosphatase-like HAD family hydrolase